MPKSFADSESQIMFMLMVCKMRNLSVPQIQAEIQEKLHINIDRSTLYTKIKKMTDDHAKEFHALKTSNTEYIANVMELKKHMAYYRALIEDTLYNSQWRQYVTPRLIYQAIELLKRIDETEFTMLKEMPQLFAWGGVKNQRTDGMFGEKDESALNKDIDQFVISMEQISVPRDIEKLQKEVEDKSLGAFQQKTELRKDSKD